MFVFEFWLTYEKVSVIISFGRVCKLVIIVQSGNKMGSMLTNLYTLF